METSCDDYCSNYGCRRVSGCPAAAGVPSVANEHDERTVERPLLRFAVYAAVAVFLLGLGGAYVNAFLAAH